MVHKRSLLILPMARAVPPTSRSLDCHPENFLVNYVGKPGLLNCIFYRSWRPRFDFARIKTLWLISLNKSRVVSASVCFPKQIVNFEVRYAINLQQQRGRSRNTSCAKGRGGQRKCDCSWKEDRKKRDVRGEGSKSLKIAWRIMWTTPTTPTPLDHPTLKC